MATLATWAAAGALLSSLHFLGLALDALVSLVSVVILLVITNWFFHRIYWTGWVAGFHARKRRWLDAETGQLAGMAALGFTSTYREGFETVLFLHTLGLQTSGNAVGVGVAIGLVAVALAGGLVLGLQLRLPYKRMLVATGVLISLVLFVMVGNTIHLVQILGWLPVHMLPVAVPLWLGLWLGLHGTVEGLLAQVGAAAIVFGSYWLAERRQHGPTAARAAWRTVGFAAALLVAIGIGWGASSLAQATGRQAPLSFRMTVDGAVSDPSVSLVPDCTTSCGAVGAAGGALDFAIPNPSDVPVQVMSIEPSVFGCSDTYGDITLCADTFTSDTNGDGSTVTDGRTGSCSTFAHFRSQDLLTWPTIPAHRTLSVNGHEGNVLGFHMIHLDSGTPSGCQGARYRVKLSVILEEAPPMRPVPQPIGKPAIPRLDPGSGS